MFFGVKEALVRDQKERKKKAEGSVFRMLSKLKRKFHAVKYQFSVQCVSLEPWPRDDFGVSVFWQRGQKKTKRGQTEPVLPVDVEGKPRTAVVPIEQSFKLSATLYAVSLRRSRKGRPRIFLSWIFELSCVGCVCVFSLVSFYTGGLMLVC